MLPPGHIAAGFLTAKALLHFSHANFTPVQQAQLVWWGMLFGFIPDIDTFIAFAKEKAFMVKDQKNNHRKQFTHAPVLWLLAGLVVILFAPNLYWRYVGILLWLGSWSHFLLDTIQYGIMWLWPLSKQVYAIKDREQDFHIEQNTFFGFWWTFVKYYAKTLSFFLEVIIIVSAFIVYFKK
jgi:membrane-bound metal-dependent hydrolase YbcI (DUF457 family)